MTSIFGSFNIFRRHIVRWIIWGCQTLRLRLFSAANGHVIYEMGTCLHWIFDGMTHRRRIVWRVIEVVTHHGVHRDVVPESCPIGITSEHKDVSSKSFGKDFAAAETYANSLILIFAQVHCMFKFSKRLKNIFLPIEADSNTLVGNISHKIVINIKKICITTLYYICEASLDGGLDHYFTSFFIIFYSIRVNIKQN